MIVCPYHGMEFGADGHCTKVPTQKAMPRTAFVRSFPVRESGTFIWIWMGDPEAIDAEPVDLSCTADPD